MFVHILSRLGLILLFSVGLMTGHPAVAETIKGGSVGSSSALFWLFYIATEKGMFAKEGLTIDLISVSSSADAMRQLTSGSLDMAIGTGMIDPIRAIGRGSSIAIIRVEGQSPPYSLIGKPTIKSLRDLKGKVISVGGATDITRTYVERMLATVGIKPNEVDFVYAGFTGPRFAAVQSGAVDAAIVVPPFNFRGIASGMVNLGDVPDVVKDLPFVSDQVNRSWANNNRATVKKFLTVWNNAIAWFYDTNNRAEAIALLIKHARSSKEDAEQSYDFFQKIKYFEPTGKVSRKQLEQLMSALKQLGENQLPTVEQVVLPGVTELTD